MDNKNYYEERPDINESYMDSGSSGSDENSSQYGFSDDSNQHPRYRYEPNQNSRSHQPGQSIYNSTPPIRKKANPMALSAFIISILSFVLCCCSPSLLMIGSIVSIGLAICSKIFYRGTPIHSLAIAAIIISCIGIILNICMLILSVVWLPQYLKANPEILDEMKNLFSQYGSNLSNSFYY